MSSIWRNDGKQWRLLSPSGFIDEKALHDLVEGAPQILPLAGTPNLVIVGREVRLGSGLSDLIAVEESGRIAVIEVKLSRNAEARRAIVAQILTYAAYLRGLDIQSFELRVNAYLQERGYAHLTDAVVANNQDGSFDAVVFADGLADSLAHGRFRLVLVLDSAPAELIQLVGYLKSVAKELLIDLITVSSFDVNGSQILVPQRVEPEEQQQEPTREQTGTPSRAVQRSLSSPGPEEFLNGIPDAPDDQQPILQRLCDWAIALQSEGLAELSTTIGKARWALVVRLHGESTSLATIWNEKGASISLNRSVFVRRAPNSISIIESLIAPDRLGQGTTTRQTNQELLDALTNAYREAGDTATIID